MPKMKTHKGTVKRISQTASGKIVRERASGGHFLAKKSQSRKRTIGTPSQVTGKIAKNLKRAIGA